MNFPKLIVIIALILFTSIAFLSIFTSKSPSSGKESPSTSLQEIILDEEEQSVIPAKQIFALSPKSEQQPQIKELPEANRIEEFFNKSAPMLPIVETITYKSRVSWQKGRPAWLSDYASHFKTSRHFIARSLNGKPNYLKQEVGEGDKFNVLKLDKNFEFYLIADTSRCRLWFYYIDLDTGENVLLKSYPITLGRLDSSKTSGLLTPLGCYTLGSRTAVFKPGVKGPYHGKQVEMMTVFGTRWIPFESEVGPCSAPAKGFGIHGMPWERDSNGKLTDTSAAIGKYESDGCVRLSTADIEELYAIIITRPTQIEIVRDFHDSKLSRKD